MKVFQGKVVAKKMKDTSVVEVARFFSHKTYGKRIKRTKRYHVHDEGDKTKVGQKVSFTAGRPQSKTKKWRIIEIK